MVRRLRPQSNVAAPELVNQAVGLASPLILLGGATGHLHPAGRREHDWMWVLPLCWSSISSGEVSRSGRVPQALSLPGPCLWPRYPQAAPGGECLVPAVLGSGHGACTWVSPKDKSLSLNEGHDAALQDETTGKGWSQPRVASPAPGIQWDLDLVMKH